MSRIGIVTTIVFVLLVGVVVIGAPYKSNAQDPSVQTYTSRDGSFSFEYPLGWDLQENSSGTLTITGVDALSPSGNTIRLDIVPPESAIDPETGEKETPEQLVSAFQEGDFGGPLEFTDVTRTTAGGKAAAFTTAPGNLNNSDLDFFFIAIDMGGDDSASILAQMVAGELPIYQQSILDISASFTAVVEETPVPTPTPEQAPTEVTPPVTGQQFTSTDGVSFTHATGWVVTDDGEGFIITGTDPTATSGVEAQLGVSRPEMVTDELTGELLNLRQTTEYFRDAFVADLHEDGNVVQFSEIMSLALGDKSVEYVTSLPADDPVYPDVLLLAAELGDGNFIIGYAVVSRGEIAIYEPYLFDIVASYQYTPPVDTTVTEPSTVTVEVSPAESLTGNYVSDDGLFSFNYRESWFLVGGPSIMLQDRDANSQVTAYAEITPPQSAYVLDYSGAGSAFGVIESFKLNMMEQYAFSNTVVADVGGKQVAFTTSNVVYEGNTREFMFAVVEVGGSNVALVYLETPIGQLNSYQPDVFGVMATMVSNVPPATPVTPTVIQPTTAPDSSQPSDGGTPVPDQPPVVNQPERGDGRVVLFYSNGTMTIYNSSDTPVSIEGLELVSTDGTRRFISRDYGFYFQRVFAPDRCVHIHLNTQPFSAPSFCRRTGTRQLTYLFGNWDNLYFVWHAGFNPSGTFQVQRMGETLATCSIAAGECEFQAPITYIPYE